MLRFALVLAAALVGGTLLAVTLRDHPGYVLIEIAGWQVETTLAAVALMLLVVLVVLGLLLRLLRGLVVAPAQVAQALEQRRINRGRQQFEKGLLALRSERWQAAEMELLKHVSNAPAPALSYLAAAEAAHRQGGRERRDEYLNLAAACDDTAAAAVAMARARWDSESGQIEPALEALSQAADKRGHSPQAVHALRLQLLEQSGDWPALEEELRNAIGTLPKGDIDALRERTEMALLEQAGQAGHLDQLRSRWQALPKAMRSAPDVLLVYGHMLHRLGADAEALRLIPPVLKKQWHAGLVELYGQLHADDGVAQLANVEHWLGQHGEQVELLKVAGRLCLRNRLWGRARSYFEACQTLRPSPEIALELGRLKALDEDPEGALEIFRGGLEMALDAPPTAPTKPALSAPATDTQ